MSATATVSSSMRISEALPTKVTRHTLFVWIKEMRRDYKLSQTAIALLRLLIGKCRDGDFEKGSLCGVWERPCNLADELGITVRALNDAENQLIAVDLIARTTIGKGRRFGQRNENGKIVTLFGISLAPLVNGYKKILAKYNAQELAKRAHTRLRGEISTLRQRIRQANIDAATQEAERILPGGRTSAITNTDRLRQIKTDLEAVLAAFETPPSQQESADLSEDSCLPDTSPKDPSKKCRAAPGLQTDAATARAAVRVASEDYRSVVEALGGASWHNIIRAAKLSCSRIGIDPRAWDKACAALGGDRAALCVLILDRNARLPAGHPYRPNSVRACWNGLTKHLATGGAVNLRGLLMAVDDLPASATLPDHLGATPPPTNPFARALNRLAGEAFHAGLSQSGGGVRRLPVGMTRAPNSVAGRRSQPRAGEPECGHLPIFSASFPSEPHA